MIRFGQKRSPTPMPRRGQTDQPRATPWEESQRRVFNPCKGETAASQVHCFALSGLSINGIAGFPGRCPGLVCLAPSGHRKGQLFPSIRCIMMSRPLQLAFLVIVLAAFFFHAFEVPLPHGWVQTGGKRFIELISSDQIHYISKLSVPSGLKLELDVRDRKSVV